MLCGDRVKRGAEAGERLLRAVLGPTFGIRSYLHLSGSENGYSFFAPQVGDSYELAVELHQLGNVTKFSFSDHSTGENALRLSTLLDKVGEAQPEELRAVLIQSITRSVAHAFPGKVIGARAILSVSHIPGPAEFDAGGRVSYLFVHAYDFSAPSLGF